MSVISSAIKKLRKLFINAILFDGAYEYLTSISQFELRANQEDGTLDLGMGYNGVIQQIGMEQYYDPVTNRTGSDLYDFTLVMVNPLSVVQGNRFNVIKAVCDGSYEGMLVLGLLTMDIGHNQTGLCTRFGNVRNMSIALLESRGIKDPAETWSESNILYGNPAMPGGLTNVEPDAPNLKIPCAVIKKIVGGVVTVFVRFEASKALKDLNDVLKYNPATLSDKSIVQWNASSKYFEVLSPYDSAYLPIQSIQLANGLTGFIYGNDIEVSYSHADRKITLRGDLSYLWKGTLKTLGSTWESDAHTNREGSWYLYSTDGITFAWSNTPWDFSMVMVSYVYYKTLAIDSFGIKETHRLMDAESHEEFHQFFGSYRLNGGQVTAGTIAYDTDSNAAVTPGFDQAIIKDEDLKTLIPAWVQGTYTTMHVGAGGISVFSTVQSYPYLAGASYIYVNDPTTGSLTASVTNRYHNVYQILMPVTSDSDSQKYRMIMLQPQTAHTSLAAAIAEDVRALNMGELLSISPERVIYTRITYYTNAGFSTNGLVEIPTGGITYYIGNFNSNINTGGVSSSDHTALSNLPWSSSGHTGGANKYAGFDAFGAAVSKDLPVHNSLSGLNDGDYKHLTAAQLALLNAINGIAANSIPIRTVLGWAASPITLVDGNINIAGISKTRTAKIDGLSGGTTTIATIPISLGYGAIIDYVILGTSNVPLRVGTIQAVFSAFASKDNDGSTDDNEATTEYVTFTTVISGTDCLLRATITSGTYNIAITIRIL